MRNFLKNTKGAVTVFVTMLLIPAMLVSGSAVDLARVHTARSIVQNANQLAANSVLTQYNALLNELYGLFGVAQDDPIFASLLDEYIRVSIFGERRQDTSLGTFQLFYGSNLSLHDVDFADGKDLRNEDVLRRQIEEYMKFRAPVIIVKEFLELTGLASFGEDVAIIEDKLAIDAALTEIYEKYKELLNAIVTADRIRQVDSGIPGATVGTVSAALGRIRNEFIDLLWSYFHWENEENPTIRADHAARYSAIMDNIRIRTVGGSVGFDWSNGRWAQRGGNIQGLNRTIENAKVNANRHKPRFDNVVRISRELDRMRDNLLQRVDALEARINSGECSPELRDALTARTGSPPRSLIERYRDVLSWDNLTEMAETYKEYGYNYIDVTLYNLLDSVILRNRQNSGDPSLTRAQLENLSSVFNLRLSDTVSWENSPVNVIARYTEDNFSYQMPPFTSYSGQSERHREFFRELNQMTTPPDISAVGLFDDQEEGAGDDSEARQRNMISELFNLAGEAFAGLENDQLGAKYIHDERTEIPTGINVGNIPQLVSQARRNRVIDVITDPLGSVGRAGDALLLLTYCTSVFSNYTTARPEINNKNPNEMNDFAFPTSLTGIPMSTEVNYFFQSEWEYLYNGSRNANSNLNAVSRLIFIIRIVCNYVAVFAVPEVTNVIVQIYAVFSWKPILALILGELARGAFVAAESAVDVSQLRLGHRVPLVKKGSEWQCTPSNVRRMLTSISSNNETSSSADISNRSDTGLTYSNYLMFFFIARLIFTRGAANELAGRTADLIEWNVINYQNGIFSDEEKMSVAMSDDNSFKLEDMKTDFSLTTTVDMRMLFLSMIFSQNFSDTRGIGMPRTMPVSVTDYRGY